MSTIKQAQTTVEFLLHCGKVRKHLFAACGTDSLIVRGPGVVAELGPGGYVGFRGTARQLATHTDNMVASAERLFIVVQGKSQRWSTAIEMEHVSPWMMQESVTRFCDGDDAFRAAASSIAGGARWAPEPVRFVNERLPYLVAAVCPALFGGAR